MSDRSEESELAALANDISNAQRDAAPGESWACMKRAIEQAPPSLRSAAAAIALAGRDAARADEHHADREERRMATRSDRRTTNVWAAVGVVGLVGLIVMSYQFPDPTAFQLTNWRLVRALCGGAMLGGLSGSVNLQLNFSKAAIAGTGAIAGALIFYFWY